MSKAAPSQEPVCFKCGHAKHFGECVNIAPTQNAPIGTLVGMEGSLLDTWNNPLIKPEVRLAVAIAEIDRLRQRCKELNDLSDAIRDSNTAAAQIAELQSQLEWAWKSAESEGNEVDKAREQIAKLTAAARNALALIESEWPADDEIAKPVMEQLRDALGEK